MPITTGLGEIYQYILKVDPGYEKQYDAMELRTIQDWIVKRQLTVMAPDMLIIDELDSVTDSIEWLDTHPLPHYLHHRIR